MKRYLILIFIGLQFTAKAQIEKDPSHWSYGLKKLSGNNYEVHLLCKVDDPWHIYAQKQGKHFIGTATKITFAPNLSLKLIGKPSEHGKKEIFINRAIGINNLEYKGSVDFVQKVVVRTGMKEIKGVIDYQTCTDTHCLPQTSLAFTIPVP
jgi:hypothetical protein